MILNCLAVGMGGFVGAVCRYLLSMLPFQMRSGFPVNTFVTNLIGAFLIGFIIVYAQEKGLAPEKLLLLKVGFCGGLTTFSTFSSETLGLIQAGSIVTAVAYMLLSVLVCVAGVFLGMKSGALI